MPKALNVFLLSLVFLCTSCFEVIEEVDLNEDGSGSFRITLNMSQSKKEIDAAMLLDSMGTISIPSKDYIETQALRGKAILQGENGISNVVITKDFDHYIFEVSFDFDQLSALNNAVEKVYAELSAFKYPFAGTFTFSDKKFNRKMDRQTSEILARLQARNEQMTRNATYTAIYRFNGAIQDVSNKDARVSGSGKAIMLRYTIIELARGNKTLNNEINLK